MATAETKILIDSRTQHAERANTKQAALKAAGITATIESKTITTYYLRVSKADHHRADVLLRDLARAEYRQSKPIHVSPLTMPFGRTK